MLMKDGGRWGGGDSKPRVKNKSENKILGSKMCVWHTPLLPDTYIQLVSSEEVEEEEEVVGDFLAQIF